MHLPLDFADRDDPLAAWTLVGAGAVGQAVAARLTAAGYPPLAILSRTKRSAARLAGPLGVATASRHLADLPPATRLVLCAVPDDVLGGLGRGLARVPHAWGETVVLHTSGAHDAGALGPLRSVGAALGSLHPLQTFPHGVLPAVAARAFDGAAAALEGDRDALASAQALAHALGVRAVELPTGAKARYHTAAALASNALVTLLALVHEILGDAGIARAEATALVRPLVQQTVRVALGEASDTALPLPEDVLTGPIARGDSGTLALHLAALREHLPHLLPVYAALGVETVRVAVRGDHLAPEHARPLLAALHDAVADGSNPRIDGV